MVIEQGHLTLDELFFLHLSFLELEKKDIFKNLENEEVFSKDINNSFRTFLEQIKCFQGRVRVII